jgi:hypothetical protein
MDRGYAGEDPEVEEVELKGCGGRRTSLECCKLKTM